MAHRNRWFTVLKNGWIFHGELLVMLQEALHLHFAYDGQAWPRLAALIMEHPTSLNRCFSAEKLWHPQGSKVAWFSRVKFIEFLKKSRISQSQPWGSSRRCPVPQVLSKGSPCWTVAWRRASLGKTFSVWRAMAMLAMLTGAFRTSWVWSCWWLMVAMVNMYWICDMAIIYILLYCIHCIHVSLLIIYLYILNHINICIWLCVILWKGRILHQLIGGLSHSS